MSRDWTKQEFGITDDTPTNTVVLEKDVWNSTLRRSMVLQAENDKLNDACYRLEKENSDLLFENLKYKEAVSSALNFLACADRISETECNEQLAFDALRKALEELEK